jgi:branched-chain amino acid transport system substrate-binding protein
MKNRINAVVFLTMTVCAFFPGCKNDSGAIKIGGIFPLSGGAAVFGIEARNGILLAIDEINAAGGIDGKRVELISEDDENNPEKSVNAYNRLTAKDKVNVIIGSLTSGCTLAITSKAQAQKVVLITPAATAENVTNAGDFIFRTCFIDSFQGNAGGHFAAAGLGAKRAAILYNNGNDYSVGIKDNFISAFEEHGGEVVAAESYIGNDVDFNAQITKIKAVNPDIVYLPDYYSTVALIVKQLRAQGINTPIAGADGWDGVTENAGHEMLNGYYSNHYVSDSNDPKAQNFVKTYWAKFNSIPVSFAALGYDSMYLIRDAIAAAGSLDSTAIKNALKAIKGDYVTGHLSFDEKRNPIKSAVIVEIVVQDDRLVGVSKATMDPQ